MYRFNFHLCQEKNDIRVEKRATILSRVSAADAGLPMGKHLRERPAKFITVRKAAIGAAIIGMPRFHTQHSITFNASPAWLVSL
jgi:hypothetical protein